jgi:hypothetical protein
MQRAGSTRHIFLGEQGIEREEEIEVRFRHFSVVLSSSELWRLVHMLVAFGAASAPCAASLYWLVRFI